MHHIRLGQGRPLLLVHGLGGTWRSWRPVLDRLAAEREVIAVDLPGFGETPPPEEPISIPTLARAVSAFLDAEGLGGVDAAGSSMGARLVLELARQGKLGAVVSLDPGGFWKGWERRFIHTSIAASVRLVRLLQPAMRGITHSAAGRTMLFPQFSPRPWSLPADVLLEEVRSYAASPCFDALLDSLVYGPEQQGASGLEGPLMIGWGRQDRICLPRQAARAQAAFPTARLHWFESCGHFPHWDQPEACARLILEATNPTTCP